MTSMYVCTITHACIMYVCSIGKGLGYKRSELAGLDDGSTLVIGGKEIEVRRASNQGLSHEYSHPGDGQCQ